MDQTHKGQWEFALERARILVSAVRKLPGGEQELITYANAILDWIENGKLSLP